MFSKLYEKIKKIIKEQYLFFSFCLVSLVVLVYPLPYYIYSGGGLISADQRVEIKDGYQAEGSFHFCYVSELKATLPTYLLAHILPDWDLVKISDIALSKTETDEDIFLRDRLFLNAGNTNAVSLAYQKAGQSFEIKDTQNYVIYIDQQANTTLKIGDDIRKINGKEVKNLEEIRSIISSSSDGEKISFSVIREKKEIEATAIIYKEQEETRIGVVIQPDFQYETNPEILIKFSNNEAGSSGGLLLTLSIYNQLVPEDITHGLKIAGTGTIESDGTVGEISGVKYKLKGAVKEKADLFLVPNGKNYEEAIKEKKKHKYKIEIIGISTFEEALKYLESIHQETEKGK